LLAQIDFLLPNIHVFFDHYKMDETIGNLFVRYDSAQTRYDKMVHLSKGKPVIIGETGWPSAGAPYTLDSPSIPSVKSATYVLNTFLCEANRRKMSYFCIKRIIVDFDAFNADWKATMPNMPDEELHWGIATADRELKNYTESAFYCSEETYSNWEKPATCNFNVYDDKLYNCTDDLLLCPKPLVGYCHTYLDVAPLVGLHAMILQSSHAKMAN
jgi:hypothetical protein